MATVELATKYLSIVDELFSQESKTSLVTHQDFSWDGAHAVRVYSIGTASMNDYDRDGSGDTLSRYGTIEGLDATTQLMTLTNDRSFTFAIDRLDENETLQALAATDALARQLRQVCIPEIDTYTYGVIAGGAGNTETAALTESNIYTEILKASEVLDNALVPDTQRVILMPPSSYTLLKQSGVILQTEIAQDMLLRGVVAMVDGALIVRVPMIRLPENCGFIMCHPSATVAPMKLESFRIHNDPPGISGSLVEGRLVYDAFVMNNKTDGIYLHKTA